MQEDYDGTIGTLAKDPLRNLKNLGIVLVTLASRAAIRGGLSPEISFSLSDSYIQQIEECKDLALVAPLAHKAEFQYAEMVHEIKEKQKGILKKQKNPRINKCKDFIFSHLHDRITLEDLAAEADCNPNCQKSTDLFRLFLYRDRNLSGIFIAKPLGNPIQKAHRIHSASIP